MGCSNTYDDFEAGYEKDYYDQSFINTLKGEDTKVKKVYIIMRIIIFFLIISKTH